ncbi:MAG: right-handed parallel beta-helix repeat-containing protein [Bacteroidetes bacterium]|nr:right-handed parallel beta-helix repeat-containing protein [Bacteroidota bacterium]
MTRKIVITGLFLILLFSIDLGHQLQAAIVFTKAGSPHLIISDLEITNQDTILVEAGAILTLSSGVNIVTNGVILMNGTAEEPVSILPENEGIGWGTIEINSPGKISYIMHANIVDGIILSDSCHMILEHVTLTNNQDLSWEYSILFVKNASASIVNSSIYGSESCEGLQMLNSESVLVKDCNFSNIPDAVELINVNGAVIRGNWFENIPDDAIDMNNCSNTIIDSNTIIHAIDRGLELGSENFGNTENILVNRNVIIDCNEGVIFKENSSGQLNNNTFYGNQTAVSCIENNKQQSGSYVKIQNCIFSASVHADLFHDANSEIEVSYSLSDQFILSGESNLLLDPLFVNTDDYNFKLTEDSPCINSGNPALPFDPDNTISDMGAFYYNHDNTSITEPHDDFSLLEIYPNPFAGYFTIAHPSQLSKKISITLFDLKGQQIQVYVRDESTASRQLFDVYLLEEIPSGTMLICKISINNSFKSCLMIHR